MGIKVLIMDDDPDVRDVIKITLQPEGYECIEAGDGEEGLKLIQQRSPDLVLVDYQMPKLNGAQVCRTIKNDLLLRHLPIIMVTGKGETSDKIGGIEAGADDYIVKPFEPKELVARIRMVLRRTGIDQEANPLTRLPGNISITNEIFRRISSGNLFAVCYEDLNNFKAYNDKYGFERGDNALRELGRAIIRAVQEAGSASDFIGHIGGDDFVVITAPAAAENIANKIIQYFDAAVPSFYNEEDRKNGYILAKDRQGVERKIPLMAIAIGIVTNETRKIANPLEVGEIGAELKHYAKRFEKSCYVKDKRKDKFGARGES